MSQHHIPSDFRYLTIVESGLQASATSSKGAHGYWQFMPETARAMGLVVNKKTDERRNLVKSTHAACRYFKHLFEQLGSWTLVAAAYNSGPGRLDTYMTRAQSMNYYDLQLNRETGEYLYRVIATKELFTRPQRYNTNTDIVAIPRKKKVISSEKDEEIGELFVPTTKAEVANNELGFSEKAAVNTPKIDLMGTITTYLREAGTSQKGQIWVFEVTQTQTIENTLIETGDRLYATVEDINNGLIFLRVSRIYSVHRHSFYILPLAAINATGQLGIAPTHTDTVIWKRL